MTTHSFYRVDRIQADCPSLSNAWIPWAQWLALITMTAEHIARFVLPEEWGIAPWATLLGRIALPLFAGMVAWHAVYNTRNPLRYARRLLIIGLVAQLPYMLALDLLRLNICFTLAAGLGLSLLVESAYKSRQNALLAALALLLAILIAPYVEYGLPGLLLIPAYVLAFRCPDRLFSSAPLLLFAYLINDIWLFSAVSLLVSTLLLAINAGLLRQIGHVTPMPRRLWLAWYPLHLSLIALALPVLAWARPSL